MSRRLIALVIVLLLVAAAAAWHRLAPLRSVISAKPQAEALAYALEPSHARVDDMARILAPFGTRLGRMADDFNQDLGIDVHVVTQDVSGSAIEEQSEQVFRERNIGMNAATGGVLILLNPALRAARIEVGYSLEGGLTDLHMGRIARDQLAPYVSYASAGMAVMDVLHHLRDQVYLSAARGNIELGEEFRRHQRFVEINRFVSGGAGAKTALSSLPIDADLKRPLPAAERKRYAPSEDVRESVIAFLRSTVDLAGDPSLELFTEGSRLMRTHYPMAPFEVLERAERLNDSMPLDYHVQGDYAVATSQRPVTGFVPILLHREDALWRIDLVETWKNLFFDSDGNYFLRNSNTPYRFGLGQFGEGRHYDIAPLPLGGHTITQEISRLEGIDGTLSRLWRAETWLRNAFVFPKALEAYEDAVRSAPSDPLVLQTFGERAMYLGFPELAIPALEKAGPGFELSLAEAWHDLGDGKQANLWVTRALEDDRYNLHALNWRKFLAEKHGTPAETELAEAEVALVRANPRRLVNPVWLRFDPQVPQFHPRTTVESDGVAVHDHSRFRVTMTNTSARAVVIESVKLSSDGTAAASGLGDVRDYWTYPTGERILSPGESASFDKLWGFTVDTGHEHVRYTFRTCWHGVGETVRQCRVQWVDVLP